MRRADRVTGAALLALAIAFSVGALKKHDYWSPNGPGPAFLPFWLGLVMAVLAVILLVGAVRATDPGEDWVPRGDSVRRLAVVSGLTIALVALLNTLGMVLGTFLFLVAMMRLLDRLPWRQTILVAAAMAAFVFLVFSYWLRVPLPVGVLGF